MKGTYLVVILYMIIFGVALNESVIDIPTKCPETDPWKLVFLPHESDCTKFYNCYMGKKGKPLDCPLMDDNGNRLHFNPKLQICDWPWNAGCQILSSTPLTSSPITTPSSSPTPTTPTPSTPTPTTPTPSTPTPTTPTPSTPTPTTPTPSTPTPTTPTPSTPTPTTPTPSTPTPTTPTPSTPTPTTPTPSTPTPTTPTPSTPTPTTPTPSTPTPTTPTPSTPTPTTPTPSTPTPTTPTPSTPTPTTPTPSSPTPTTPTPSTPTPTTPTPSTPTPTTPTPSSPTPTTPTPSSPTPTTPIPSSPTPTTSTPSSPSPTTPSSNSCISDNRIHMIPHKTLCNYYYLCLNGWITPIPQKCDRNLLFNSLLRVCDYPENVNCNDASPSIELSTRAIIPSMSTNPSSTSPWFSSTPIKSKPADCESNKQYKISHEIMCDHYYWCINGIKDTQSKRCESNLLFNPIIGECDYRENVNCNDRRTPSPDATPSTISTTSTPEISTKDPNKFREKCPPKGSTEKARIAHPCLCNQYYECIDGEKILQTCSIGKHFDYVKEICNWVSRVKCIRPIPTFNIPVNNYNTCAPEGRAFQHKTDCSAYYLCSNGKKILRNCMEGLHFNVTIQMCDYPQKSCDLNRSLPIINVDICPSPGSVEKVFLPHECECTQYYECINGKKVLRSCPNRLHFDRVWQICNNPIEAKCVPYTISPITTPRTTPATTPIIPAIDKSRRVCPPKGSTEKLRLPHPCLCNQYYECVEGDKVLRTCPINMYFDNATEICDWNTKVKCIQPFPSHDIQIGVSKPDNKCFPDGKAFRHEVSCTEYYLCSKGKKVLKHCIEGLHFNVSIQMCDYPQKKECDLTTSVPAVTFGVCPPPGSVKRVILPHECDCTQYYECIDGKQILRSCSDGLHYDYVRQICNVPIEAKCNNFATTPKTWTPSTPDSSKCYDENNEMPHENDCRSYYKCSDGKKILKTCPRNLYFNPNLRVCDYPENVICDAESTNVPGIPTSIKCDTMTETTEIPHETDCNLYYVCENGVSILKKCSPKLVFNPILKVCDFPENYICDVKKIDKTIQNLNSSTCIGTCPEDDPPYAVLLPNDDCKKFCMCSGGVAWVQSCPEPLYFDTVQNICKRKKDAVCGTRFFEQDNTFTIAEVIDNDNFLKFLTDENNDEHEAYDNLDPSTCIGTCPEEDPDYALLLPNDDCKKFCMCSGGVAWVQSCPEPLYFDSVQNICKRKKDAVCGRRFFEQDNTFTIAEVIDNDNFLKFLTDENNDEHEAYDNLDPSTCIGTCPEEDPDYALLLPNDDCKKFCMCSGGVAWVQSCPEPLYFDSVEKICKRKKDAVCGKRFNKNHVFFMFDKK